MKKVLFATTALVATAGMAAADINFSGYGRFGARYADPIGAAPGATTITSRFRLTIDGSTEADNGLSFGARVRIQQNGAATGGTTNAARFYAKSGGLELGVGNIYGAFGSMPGLFAGSVGLTGLGWGNVTTNFASHTYSSSGAGNATNGVELIYSGGNFTAHLSNGNMGGNKRTEIAGNMKFGDWTVGLGFANATAARPGSKALLTVGGKLGAANIGLSVAQHVSAANVTAVNAVLSGSFEVGAATTIIAYIGQDKTQVAGQRDSYGLGVSHSLGGGASLQAGVAKVGAIGTMADVGVLFNF